MGPREMLRGLRQALVDPIRQDFANGEALIYRARKANPGVDLALSVFPGYGIPSAIQDAARADTSGDAAVDMMGALPLVRSVKGLRAAAKELGRTTRSGAPQVYAMGAAGAGAVANDRVNDFRDAEKFQMQVTPHAR